MGKTLLKISEKIQKERALKELEKQRQVIAEIDAKEKCRQAKVDAVEQKYQVELTRYKYRCETFIAQMPAFDRLCWFIAERGQHRKKFSDTEWSQIIADAGLTELVAFINQTGGNGINPPVKHVVDPLEGD